MKVYKTPLSVRGDSIYCPLSLSLDSYWQCETNCHHCYLRAMNRTWGTEQRVLDPDILDKKLTAGVKNKNPQTPLAHCLANKNTIRFGNKTDPFQKAELEHRVSKECLEILEHHEWTYVIQTKFTHILMEYGHIMTPRNATIMPVISPGLDKDREILERGRTTSPETRLGNLKYLVNKGHSYGINGEPFIPGYHTLKDFKDTLLLIKDYGFNRYNTYNLHLNPFVARRLHELGLDIEKIWEMNQDKNWKPILQKLISMAERYGIRLGCPDFVNSGPYYHETTNTCCSVDAPNPTTWNTHTWKRLLQARRKRMTLVELIERSWDGSGDWEDGLNVLRGTREDVYTMKDAGFGHRILDNQPKANEREENL